MKKLLNTLYVTVPYRYLSAEGDTVVLKQEGEKIAQLPLHNLERIITFGGTGATSDLMEKCTEKNIDLVFVNQYGSKFIARIQGRVTGNVLLRRQQYRNADNDAFSLAISRHIIGAKLYNSRWVLERTIRGHAMRIDTVKFKQKSEMLKDAVQQSLHAENMGILRGIEGKAASVYFSVFDDMILQQKDVFSFTSRNKRPPLDYVNALLSFSYSIVTNICASALESVGLDPYVGFMHTDRSGRCSLALDIVEEFRPILCDRFVLTIINKRIINSKSFEQRENGAVFLTQEGKKAFFTAWENRKQEELYHPFLEKKIKWGLVPYAQALLLATYIRGDLDCYPPFMWK